MFWNLIHIYDAKQNAGIVFGPEWFHFGFEWRGIVGWFFSTSD